MYVSVCPSDAYRGQEGMSESPELKLWSQTVESCHVGARNQTRVLYKGIKFSQLLGHLSGPLQFLFIFKLFYF